MSKLAHAYIDESGRSGPLDGLVEKDDHLIAVIASLVVPADETVFREVFDGPFDAFCKARRPTRQSRPAHHRRLLNATKTKASSLRYGQQRPQQRARTSTPRC